MDMMKMGQQLLANNQRMPLSQRRQMQGTQNPFANMTEQQAYDINEILKSLGIGPQDVPGAGAVRPDMPQGMQPNITGINPEAQDELERMLSQMGGTYGLPRT